jgi:hypothetical protein
MLQAATSNLARHNNEENRLMKKTHWMVSLAVVALGGAGAAPAADISNINGQSCGDLTGTWHFVNNQTAGAAAGTLTASWDSGDSCTATPSKVLPRVQHFYCSAKGALSAASTDLPGRLVLSDFSCETKPPPPCDPKVEKCEEPPPPPPCDPKVEKCE